MGYYIKLANQLDRSDYKKINQLQELCLNADKTSLKLELEYKLAKGETAENEVRQLNEFMCFDGEQVVGYIGICDFGGDTIEVNGMVHPDYRRKGIFKKLFSLVRTEWIQRPSVNMLILSDKYSVAGQAFIQTTGAAYEHSEYEMFIRNEGKVGQTEERLTLRKATNRDAKEIARLNTIFFDDGDENSEEHLIMPEEEEKLGYEIFIAELDNETVGKIHLETANGVGGIYGLGIIPQYRGKGYGRELLSRGVDILRSKGNQEIKLQVEVNNENALGLYKSCGFEITSVMDYYALKK